MPVAKAIPADVEREKFEAGLHPRLPEQTWISKNANSSRQPLGPVEIANDSVIIKTSLELFNQGVVFAAFDDHLLSVNLDSRTSFAVRSTFKRLKFGWQGYNDGRAVTQ